MQCNFQSALIFLCCFVHREMSRWLVRDGKERTFPRETMFSPPFQNVDVTITLSPDLMGHHWVIQDQALGLTTPTAGKLLLRVLCLTPVIRSLKAVALTCTLPVGISGGESW